MKCTTIIDKEREEEVIIYLHEENKISQKIEELISQNRAELIGYTGNSVTILQPEDVYCFTVENNKIFALTEKERYRLKQRLYSLEETFGEDFLKINQSCIVNVKAIQQFDVSLGGSLMILLKNGYRDYVSRRQLKAVKERIGFKI
jgi:DNA-binding LytR/AlgR family response regulator